MHKLLETETQMPVAEVEMLALEVELGKLPAAVVVMLVPMAIAQVVKAEESDGHQFMESQIAAEMYKDR